MARMCARVWIGLFVVGIVTLSGLPARGDDIYLYRRVGELKTTIDVLPDGSTITPLPEDDKAQSVISKRTPGVYAWLQGEGEVYLDNDETGLENQKIGEDVAGLPARTIVAVRLLELPADKMVTGWIYANKPSGSGVIPIKFQFKAELISKDSKRVFATAKQNHYKRLMNSRTIFTYPDQHDDIQVDIVGIPGAAWFQSQIRAAQALAGDDKGGNADGARAPGGPFNSSSDAERMFALFSGGRAINENLQLDRRLTVATTNKNAVEKPSVKLDTLGGISVAEIDWKPLLAGKTPTADPLAKLVPQDQHALFIPSLKAAGIIAAEASSRSVPVWQMLGIDNLVKAVLERYEMQLGVSLGDLAKLPESVSIKGLVLTGSDPYFVSGTDIGLVFSTGSSKELAAFLREYLEKACQDSAGRAMIKVEEKGGVQIVSARDEDRRISAYIAVTPDAVILTNSPSQLDAILATQRGERPALASSLDYQYFRVKYALPEVKESAFLVLSDATIRRWCGPKWRIGSSRRLRVAAALAALQADHLGEVVAGKGGSGSLPNSAEETLGVDLGEVTIGKHGIRSRNYGTLAFQTPISELSIETVTKSEAEAYSQWRDGYQSNWRGTFDPIALRLNITEGKPKKIGLDLTVTPLIMSTDYRDMVKLVGGATFAPNAGDPHPESILHAIMAVDVKSSMFQTGAGQLVGMTNLPKETVLGWVGSSVSLYVDESPVWAELLGAKNQSSFLESHLSRLPVGAHIAATDGLKLALFLTAVRGFIEQSAPGMVRWENLDYRGKKYVKIAEDAAPRPELRPGQERFAIYYAPTPKALVVSPNEDVIKRFLDRLAASAETKPDATSPNRNAPEWLGKNLGLRVKGESLKLIQGTNVAQYVELIRSQSWANLPILNEWHRLYPDRDPVKFHEEFWGECIVCPAGGEYVWDQNWRTMKSTVTGHPGEPIASPKISMPLPDFGNASLGVNFEDGGLRGRVEIESRD